MLSLMTGLLFSESPDGRRCREAMPRQPVVPVSPQAIRRGRQDSLILRGSRTWR